MPTKRLSQVDRETLARVMQAAVRDKELRAHIARAEADDVPPLLLAIDIACQMQAKNLRLPPWQSLHVPGADRVRADDEDDPARGPRDGRKAAATLLKRMLDAGLSRYEPDPARALALQERRA